MDAPVPSAPDRSRRSPRRSAHRPVAAAACAVTALAHLPLVHEHLEVAPYVGVLFLALVAGCLVLAVLLLRRDCRWVWGATALLCLGAVAAYAWSRSVGLPLLGEEVGRWVDPLGVVAVAAETWAGVLALRVLTTRTAAPGGPGPASRRPAVLALVVLLVGTASTGVAAATAGAPGTPPGSAVPGMGAGSGPAYWQSVAGPLHPTGRTRTYYLSADPVTWDYAPQGRNDITGEPFDAVADTWVQPGAGRIGSRYLKCLYRGYTDASFEQPQARTADEAGLGLLGPVLRAEVGDEVVVVFRNTCPFPTSVHPHGVLYGKSSEGAPYSDGTAGGDKADDAVPTGGQHVYRWLVPDRAGPGPADGSSVMWMYHSHTDEVGDTYAGLMGPMVVTRRGSARADGAPRDVDREVFAVFSVMNENKSPLLQQSAERFEQPYVSLPPDDPGFEESNLMHSVNGYVFGNQPLPTLRRGQHVRWYVMSMGTEVDLHTPHWHGNDVLVAGMRMDVVDLLPASMVVADMVPDNAGTWLFHCHVNDHITAGMLTRYRVVP